MEDEQKRKQIAVRLSPQDRQRVMALAELNGSSVGAEIEQMALDQLAYIEGTDPETRELLARIGDKITEMHRLAKGKWHKNLTAWAAVTEALAHIMDNDRPESTSDDERVSEVTAMQSGAFDERYRLVGELSELGLAVKFDPGPSPLLGQVRHSPLSLTAPDTSSRSWEQAAINAMPDNEVRLKVQAVFDQLLAADARIEQLATDWTDAMLPYWQAEQEGRKIGRGNDPTQPLLASLFNLPALSNVPRRK